MDKKTERQTPIGQKAAIAEAEDHANGSGSREDWMDAVYEEYGKWLMGEECTN